MHESLIAAASGALIPTVIPNQITEGQGFYISFNDHDIGIYGEATTALVVGQMQAFYILNGDHRAAYQPLIRRGLAACLDYFIEHGAQSNKYSDTEAVARREKLACA